MFVNLVIVAAGLTLMGAASWAGFCDECRASNPVFWFVGLPCFAIGLVLAVGGVWKSLTLLAGG